jgi:predicted component of type VI protein secretion system
VIANAGEIFDTTSSDKNDRMLLQIMSDAGNIRSHFDSVGEPHPSDLSQRRVRLLGRGCVYTRAHPALLRTTLQGGRRVFAPLLLSAFAD